jgi:hypothetical protein
LTTPTFIAAAWGQKSNDYDIILHDFFFNDSPMFDDFSIFRDMLQTERCGMAAHQSVLMPHSSKSKNRCHYIVQQQQQQQQQTIEIIISVCLCLTEARRTII